MKGRLARAVANTRLRVEEPRNRFARQPVRWFAPTPTVPPSRFQDAVEPFPRHWRRFPEPWAMVDPADPKPVTASAAQPDEFACKELVELVTDYLDGVLPPELKDAFQTHLASCDGCVEYVRQIGLTIRALKEADLHLAPRPQALAARDPDRPDR